MIGDRGPVRIAFCIDSFGVGGTELNAVRLAEALDPSRCTLAVCHLQPEGPLRPRYEAMGATLHHVPIPNLYSPATVRAGIGLARWLRTWRADVLHAHDIYSNIFAAPWARLGSRAAVIASRRWWYDAPRPGLVPLNRWSYRFAHRVLANSSGVAKLLQQEEKVPADKILEIPNFVEERAFQRVSPIDRAATRRAWGIGDDAFLVGIVARLAPVKNHEILLRAVARLDEGVHLMVVGDGPSRVQLEQLASELGISGRTRFLGQVVQPVNIHQYFDVSVLCSKSEGFPNSVIEALAAARAVVATPVGGVTDVISNGVTGLLAEVNDVEAVTDALAKLRLDTGLRDRLGAAGCARVRTCYHQDLVVGRLMSVYEALAAQT